MRTAATYRSLPPALIDDTLHQWVGDGPSGYMVDLCGYGGTRLVLDAEGTSLAAGFGSAQSLVFDGSDDVAHSSTSSAADKTAMLGTVTATVGFALDSSFSAAGTLVAYGKHYDDDKSCVFEVYIDANRNVNVFWYNGESDVLLTFTGYTFALGKPYEIAVVRDVTSNNCKLYVLGELVETITAGYADPSVSGTGQEWYVGASSGDDHWQHIKGSISSVTIDHRARTVDEIVRDARRALLWDGETSIFSRAKVKDHDGDWQDLSSLYGNNFYLGGGTDDSSDNAVKEAEFQIRREVYDACLSKYHDNLLNRPGDWDHIGPTHAYVTDGHEDLLDIGREIKHEWARMPLDSEPSSSDWRMEFHGYITNIDWSQDPIVVTCRDLGAKYNAAYVERATVFPTDESDDHSLFHVIYDGGSGHGIMDKLHSAGWVDGSCPTCYDEAADGIGIEHWTQERAAALPVMQSMAEQVGQLFRWKWQYVASDFCPTLWTPARDKTYADCCLTANDYVKLTKLSVCIDDVRNAVQVLFPSTDPGSAPAAPALAAAQYGGWGAASNGQPGQYFVIVYGTDVDASYSMTQYWRQFCEISEGSSGLITSYEMAERLAVAVCSDLFKPYALMTAALLLFPEIEIEDMCYFSADGHHTTVDFRHAVFDVSHDFDRDTGGTTLTLRGKPSGGFKRHLLKETRTCGALPGVRDPDDIQAGRSSRWRLASAEFISDRLNESQVKNPDFTRQSRGASNMADSWEVGTGTFGTDVEISTSAGKLGDKCLKLIYNAGLTATVWSNYFPVSDEMGVEVYAITKHSATGITSKVDVAFYTDDVGSGEDIDTGISKVNANSAWAKEKVLVGVPSGKKYARLKVYTSGLDAAGEYALFDLVTVRIVSAAVGVPGWTGTSLAKGSPYTTPITIGWGTETYDYGSCFSTPTFTAPKSGIYSVRCCVAAYDVSGMCTTYDAHIAVYVGSTCVAAGPKAQSTELGGDDYWWGYVYATLALVAGDTVQIKFIYDTDPGTSTDNDTAADGWLYIQEHPS